MTERATTIRRGRSAAPWWPPAWRSPGPWSGARPRRDATGSGTGAGAGPGPSGVRTRNQRRAELARVGGRAGADFALHRARRVFAGAHRHAELDEQFQLRTATQVAEALGNMKGAFMKLGQMASYLDVGLPDHVREALASSRMPRPCRPTSPPG